MAQLVKLLDYVSRYENDLSHYPTQYIRLKRYQWDRLKLQWENGADHLMEWQQSEEEAAEQPEEGKWFSPFFRLFGRRKEAVEEEELEEDNEEEVFEFTPHMTYSPSSLDQLRKHYLDQLFHFQIKWASSTLLDKSKVDPRFLRDSLLRSFAQQLPDNYLLFYYPILLLKKAPVELDIIIVTPVECMCITVLEQEEVAAFVGSGERFWMKKVGESESKLLNPLISLNRMSTIVSGLFKAQDIDFPVKKYLISRNGYIDYPGSPYDVKIVDRRSYEEWFSVLQKLPVPMKSTQFKAAQALLEVGETTAMSQLFGQDEEQEEIE
ncbi:NERD domain-containing protein [Sporosarcina sp. FSL K6-1522]|uniref:NERD domain-containing protein n=1 Tax=Sporosarcina sp. FSL K6-1522 TaxID=2921554 RepID=UPI00315A75AD